MSTKVGSIHYELGMDTKGFDTASAGVNGKLGKLGGVMAGLGTAMAVGVGAAAVGLGALTLKMVNSGAELEQQLGGAEAVFGQFADGIKQKAEDAFSEAGLSQAEFLQGANKMGSLFQGAGFDVKTSMDMSAESIQRASDIASIMGISTEEALQAVTGMAKGNFTMMDNLGVAMNDTAIGAYAMAKGINKSTSEMSIQEKIGLAQQMFMEKTAKYAGNYAKENQTLAGSINSTKKAFENLLTGEGDVDAFIEMLVNTIEIAVPKIQEALPKIAEAIGKILPVLVGALATVLPSLIPPAIGAVKNLIQAIVDNMPAIISALLEALPVLISAFVELFLAIVQALPQIVTIIAEALPTIIDAIVTNIANPDTILTLLEAAVELFLALVNAIPLIIVPLVNALPVIIRTLTQTLTSPRYIHLLIYATVELLKAIIRAIPTILGSLRSAAWEIIKTIANTLKPSTLLETGKNLIRGLWNGIKDMGGWLKDKLISFVKDKIPGPVKKALGISSPSKLFAGFGRNINEGFALGITNSANLVGSAIDKVTDGVSNAGVNTSNALNKTLDGLQGNIGITANATSAGQGAISGDTNIYGNITIGSKQDADYFLGRINRQFSVESVSMAGA